jgi:hypothetical protein
MHWSRKMGLVLMIVTLMFSACDERRGLLPTSGGKSYEVLVVADRDNIVANTLSADVEGLPQPEPCFDVSTTDSAHFKGALHMARNIVMVNIDPHLYSGFTLRYEKNVYAKPQLIVHLGAPSVEVLRKGLAGKGGQQLLKLLNRSEMRSLLAQLRHHRNVKAERLIKQKFGIEMWIPQDMVASKESDDFVWLSNNSATMMKNIVVYRDWNKWSDSNGLLYYYEDAMTYFERARNYVLGRNILGEADSMHMSTVTVSMVNKEPGDWYHGLWEMTGDDMGGPFVSRLLNMPKEMFRGNYACFHVVGEGFVFAPGKQKRNAIKQLEAALHTMKYPDKTKENKKP